jgi:curved DNA-binding protein CbpA
MSTRTGPLDAVKLYKVFRSLQEQRLTGLLVFSRGQVQKKSRVIDGVPVRVSSNARRETALGSLLDQGFLSAQDADRIQAERARLGVTLEDALVQLGFVDPAQIRALEARLTRRRLLDLFTWVDGTYAFTPGPLKAEPGDHALDLSGVLLEAAAQVTTLETCSSFLAGFAGQGLVPTVLRDKLAVLYDAQFPGANARQALQRVMTVEQLVQHFRDAERVHRQVFALVMAGLYAFRPVEVAAPPKTTARAATPPPKPVPTRRPSGAQAVVTAPTPAPRSTSGKPQPPPGPKPVREARPLDDKARKTLVEVDRLFEVFKTQTHYEVLGVPRDADAAAASARFRKLALEFHVDRFSRYQLAPDTMKKVQEVFMALNRAHETLTSAPKRAEYDAHLEFAARGQSLLGASGAPDVGLIFRAEQHVRDGVLLLRNGNVAGARARFAEALKATPGDVVARSGTAFADFLTAHAAQDRAASDAARSRLEEAAKENENREEPFVYLGRMYRTRGDDQRAVAAFKRALEVNPRCAEASSELRHLQRRTDGAAEKPAGGLFGRKKS